MNLMKNQSLPTISMMAVLLGIAAGFMVFGVNRDYYNYSLFYDNLYEISFISDSRFEPGFVFLSGLVKFVIKGELNIAWFLFASLSLLIKLLIFSNYRRPGLSVLFYLLCLYPLHEYTQIRIAVALAFSLWAAEYYFKDRLVPFLSLMVVAFAFHASSFVFAFAIPVAYSISRFRLTGVIVSVMVIVVTLKHLAEQLLLFARLLNPLSIYYVERISDESVNLFSGVNILTVTLLVSSLWAGSLRDRRDKSFFFLVIFGLAIFVVLADIPVFAQRFREMFFIFLVPLAFNMRLTHRGWIQLSAAIALAFWYLYSHITQGVIGVVI